MAIFRTKPRGPVIRRLPLWGELGRLRFLFYRLDNAKWWVLHRLHPRHRYHVVRTGLGPGYHDFDVRILHACFECLRQFVEIELHKWKDHNNPALTDRQAWMTCGGSPDMRDGAQVRFRTEAMALYDWWTKDRPARADPWAKEPWDRSVDGDAAEAVDDRYLAEDQAMLHRLIEIRSGLWT